MDNTYCPYCLHRMDKDELTDEGLREELARRLYPDAEELQKFPGFCSECRRPFPEPRVREAIRRPLLRRLRPTPG